MDSSQPKIKMLRPSKRKLPHVMLYNIYIKAFLGEELWDGIKRLAKRLFHPLITCTSWSGTTFAGFIVP